MKVTITDSTQVVMSNPQSIHNYFAWPTVARLKDGRIAVAASGFRLAHVCPFGKAVISYSTDEGKTYTAPAPIIDTALDDRDAGLCPFGKSGLIITSFNNTVDFQRDVQMTHPNKDYKDYILAYLDTITPAQESEYLGYTYKISNDNGVTFSKLCKSPITSPHGPIELKNGTVLWVGTCYSENAANRIQAYKINTDGTCELVGEIPPVCADGETHDYDEPYAFETGDGTIICHIRMDDIFTLYQTESSDGGKTWSQPHRLLPDNGGAPAHIMRHSSGTLIVTYGYRQEPYSIKAMFSNDGGKTWGNETVICPGLKTHDIGYPSTVELADSSLITVFYNYRIDGSDILQQKWNLEV